MKLLRCLLVLSLAVAWAGAARALPITLALVPSAVSLAPDDPLTVSIEIDGLDGIALEGFSFQLQFDETRLQYVSLEFGIYLGGDPYFAYGDYVPNSGVLMAYFASLDVTEEELLDLQAVEPFALVTIEFTALDNPGQAELQLNLDETSLVGWGGVALAGDVTPPTLVVNVLPEPATATLLIAALALLGLRRRSFAS